MKKHNGFTLTEGLLVLIVVLILSLGGYYVWAQQNDNDNSESLSNGSQNIEGYRQCSSADNYSTIEVSSEINDGEFLSKHQLIIEDIFDEEQSTIICATIENKSNDGSEQNLDNITYYSSDIAINKGNESIAINKVLNRETKEEFTEQTLMPNEKLDIAIYIETTEQLEDINLTWSPGGNVYGTGSTQLESKE